MRSAGVRALLVAAAVTASLAVPGAVSAARTASGAAAPDLFVGDFPGMCSDSGGGTEQQPFCTIGAAVAAAQPGQTVLVHAGSYPSLTVTRSGAPGAPITIRADTLPGAPPAILSAPSPQPAAATGPAMTVSGVHDIVISGFQTGATGQSPAIDVENSSDITIDSAAGTAAGAPAVQVSGMSGNVTVSRSALSAVSAPAVEAGTGTAGLTVTASTIAESGGGAPAMQITGSTGAVLTGNTVVADCAAGIMLSGGSTGAAVENNIVETAPSATAPAACTSASPEGIGVSADSASQSVSNFNLIDPASGGPLYDWAGTDYASLADFAAATGQGTHDIAADPDLAAASNKNFSWFTLGAASPAIDSADAGAPAELSTDQLGDPRAQDPAVPDTGASPGYFDRGAVELEGPVQLPALRLTPDPASTLGVTATAAVDESWATNVVAGADAFTFFAGSPLSSDTQFPVLTAPPGITHTFTAPGFVGVIASRSFAGMDTSSDEAVDVGFGYTPVTPSRILDTRHGIGVAAQPVPAGATLTLPFTGAGQVPAAQIGAVNLNVTVTQPASAGSLTVFSAAAGTASGTSNLSFAAGQTVANLVTVQPGSTGIEFHNGSNGTVQVIADLDGYYGTTGSSLTQLTAPERVLDTRSGTGARKAAVAAGGKLTLNLAGEVPAGATAALLNVTVTQPGAAGFLTAFGTGQPVPTASDINFARGQTVANAVIVPLVNGRASFFNGSGGAVQLIADLSGYFSSLVNLDYLPNGPVRIASTSSGFGVREGPVPAGGTLTVTATASPGDVATVLNVTVTQPARGGFLTVYPAAQPRPGTSSLNFAAGQTVAIQVTAGGGRQVKIFNGSGGTVQLVVDQQGEYDLEIP